MVKESSLTSVRREQAELLGRFQAGLSNSVFSGKLHELGIPSLIALLNRGQRDEQVGDLLTSLQLPRLARIGRKALENEQVADRLVFLEFHRLVYILEHTISEVLSRETYATSVSARIADLQNEILESRKRETPEQKATAKLTTIRFPAIIELFELAVENGRSAEILRLYGFHEVMRTLGDRSLSTDISGLLARFDFFRLKRLVLATRGLERILANSANFTSGSVLRRKNHGVTERRLTLLTRMREDPYKFDFYWALRCLQVAHPAYPKIGESLRLADDYIRVGQEPDLRFQTSTLRRLSFDGDPFVEISVNFLGLFGPNGALPLHMTDYAIDRIRDGDRSLVGFLNVFHHRTLSLFFRAWAAHQKAVDLDRLSDRRFANYVASFVGFGMKSLRREEIPATGGAPDVPRQALPPQQKGGDEVPDLSKLYFSGRLAPQAKNAEGLAAILSEFFGVVCEIQNFIGHWIKIPDRDVCRLGASAETGSLGTTAIVGSTVYQYQTKFRIRLGPMTFAEMRRLLPCEEAWRRLKAWVWNYIGKELLWDVQYVLRANEVPTTQLGSGALLGWTTWVQTAPPSRDAEDVIIDSDLH